jgi:ribonuclease-3
MPAESAALELKLNYRFANPELLHRALMHSSLANEMRAAGTPAIDNEQLEFLGDAVLGFLVSEALVRRHPEAREG